MLLGTPFQDRTEPLCRSGRWRNWSGFAAAIRDEVDLGGVRSAPLRR